MDLVEEVLREDGPPLRDRLEWGPCSDRAVLVWRMSCRLEELRTDGLGIDPHPGDVTKGGQLRDVMGQVDRQRLLLLGEGVEIRLLPLLLPAMMY